MCPAGGWKPVTSAGTTSPPAGSTMDKLQEQPQTLAPIQDKEQKEQAVVSHDPVVSRSRSGSKERGTGPDGSECSEGSDEEEDSSSPAKIASKRQKSSSRSASPGVQKQQLSRSPTDRKKLSLSTSSPRRRFVVYLYALFQHCESAQGFCSRFLLILGNENIKPRRIY